MMMVDLFNQLSISQIKEKLDKSLQCSLTSQVYCLKSLKFTATISDISSDFHMLQWELANLFHFCPQILASHLNLPPKFR